MAYTVEGPYGNIWVKRKRDDRAIGEIVNGSFHTTFRKLLWTKEIKGGMGIDDDVIELLSLHNIKIIVVKWVYDRKEDTPIIREFICPLENYFRNSRVARRVPYYSDAFHDDQVVVSVYDMTQTSGPMLEKTNNSNKVVAFKKKKSKKKIGDSSDNSVQRML